jgi:hypothetical protein
MVLNVLAGDAQDHLLLVQDSNSGTVDDPNFRPSRVSSDQRCFSLLRIMYAAKPPIGIAKETANHSGPRMPRNRESWNTHKATRKNAMYSATSNNQRIVGVVDAAA